MEHPQPKSRDDASRRQCVARGGEVAFTSPSVFEHAKLYGFAVPAGRTLVDEMLTRYINRPSQDLGCPIDVRATRDQVFFVFLDSERRQRPRDRAIGSEGRQSEQLFAVVVPAYRVDPNPGPVLFAPYIYATETPGWRVEREIFGYPQQHGRVRIRLDRANVPYSLSMETPSIVRFAPNAMATHAEILRIHKNPLAPGAGAANTMNGANAHLIAEWRSAVPASQPSACAEWPYPRFGATAADVKFFERTSRAFPTPNLIAYDEPEVLPDSWRMLFLKQFRDIAYADRACYQAIVEATFSVTGQVNESTMQDYVLDLYDTDTTPIRRELGIPPGTVAVDFAFRYDIGQLSVQDAKVVSNPYWSPAVEVSLPDEPSRLPRYVDRGGEAVWRHPSLLYGARIYGFGVKVPEAHQQEVLDQCVNNIAQASASTYGKRKFRLCACAGLDMVMLLFVEYQRVVSATDEDGRLGGTAYREFLAMQLALSEDPEFPELDWFIPFIYLDLDSPRLCGREIFGYPKQFGTIKPFERYRPGADGLEPAKTLELSATVIHGLKDKHAQERSVIRIDGPAQPPAVIEQYLSASDMFLDQFNEVGGHRISHVLEHLHARTRRASGDFASRRSPVAIENALAFANVGNVFLKQFRDCTDPALACYQAVCKTDTIPGKFRGGGRVEASGYHVTIQNHTSEQLLRYLKGSGATRESETMDVVFAYFVELDLELTNGRVIANPFEAPYVPDVSPGRTVSDRSGRPRVVRCSRQPQL